MPEPTPESRAKYTPPILESHPAFKLSVGCSLPGGLGCLPFGNLPIPDLQDALNGG